MTLITGVDFVCIPTDDFEASVRFYGETLGLPEVKRYGSHPGIEFQAGNLTLAILESTFFGQEFAPHSLPVSFQVDDVPAAAEELRAKGVEFVSELIDSGSCHQWIFKDPAGNKLNLHHRYA